MDYKNLNILVTGASSGIGEEFCRQFHSLGSNIILVARREDRLKKITDELNFKKQGSAYSIVADLTQDDDLKKIANFIKENRIDILVNNAGCGSFGYFEELNIENEVNQVKLNIIATQVLAHSVIPQLKARRAGGIISVSSIAAFQPLPFMATYSATKVFNYQHSLGLREELREFGVRVLTVCPGPTATEFGGVARVPGKMTGLPRDSVEAVVRESIRAFSRDKQVVVTGFKSKLIALQSKLMPKLISVKLVKRILLSSLRTQ